MSVRSQVSQSISQSVSQCECKITSQSVSRSVSMSVRSQVSQSVNQSVSTSARPQVSQSVRTRPQVSQSHKEPIKNSSFGEKEIGPLRKGRRINIYPTEAYTFKLYLMKSPDLSYCPPNKVFSVSCSERDLYIIQTIHGHQAYFQ